MHSAQRFNFVEGFDTLTVKRRIWKRYFGTSSKYTRVHVVAPLEHRLLQ